MTTTFPTHGGSGPESDPATLTIDCADCRFQHSDVCADCVVTFICSREADDAVIVDLDQLRAVKMLSTAGLVPELRHSTR